MVSSMRSTSSIFITYMYPICCITGPFTFLSDLNGMSALFCHANWNELVDHMNTEQTPQMNLVILSIKSYPRNNCLPITYVLHLLFLFYFGRVPHFDPAPYFSSTCMCKYIKHILLPKGRAGSRWETYITIK